MKKLIFITVILGLVNAHALSPNEQKGEEVYKNLCIACHGVRGNTAVFGKVPAIRNDPKEDLLMDLQQYSKGERNKYGYGHIMTKLVKDYKPDELDAVAEYVSNVLGKRK